MKPIVGLAALLVGALAAAPVSAQRVPLPPPGPIEHINGKHKASDPQATAAARPPAPAAK